jgi:Flp pilus assembly protein TadD
VIRGAALSALERWPAASAEYRVALALTPEPGVDLLNALAWSELKQGRSTEAASLLDRSLGRQPEQPEIARLRVSLGAHP